MARNAEAKIQAAVVEFVRAVAPEVLPFAVPNGGLRTRAEAALFKWTGQVPGIPDLILLMPGGRAAGWEVKTREGRLSEAQKEIRARFEQMEAPYAVIRSIEDARRELARLGVETREAKAA